MVNGFGSNPLRFSRIWTRFKFPGNIACIFSWRRWWLLPQSPLLNGSAPVARELSTSSRLGARHQRQPGVVTLPRTGSDSGSLRPTHSPTGRGSHLSSNDFLFITWFTFSAERGPMYISTPWATGCSALPDYACAYTLLKLRQDEMRKFN